MTARESSWSKEGAQRYALRTLALALLAVYIGWNLFHLSLLRVPSSLLVAMTGIPCPTTGGTRAMRALFSGDLVASLQWNPAAIPIALLAVATCARVGWNACTRRRIHLANAWLRCWLWLLAAAWLIQLSRYFLAR